GRSVPAPAQYPRPPAASLLQSDCTGKVWPGWPLLLPTMVPSAPGTPATGSGPTPATSHTGFAPTHAHLSPFSYWLTSYQPPRCCPLTTSSAPGSVTVSSISWPRTIDWPSSVPAAPALTLFWPQLVPWLRMYGMLVKEMFGVT